MTEEDYVSYEVAKLLRKKGFDETCYQKYDNERYLAFNHVGYINDEKPCDDFYALAPTHQMAMKWLREEGFIISVEPRYPNGEQKYCYNLWINGVHRDYRGLLYDTYEEAVEAALKYCLTKRKL